MGEEFGGIVASKSFITLRTPMKASEVEFISAFLFCVWLDV